MRYGTGLVAFLLAVSCARPTGAPPPSPSPGTEPPPSPSGQPVCDRAEGGGEGIFTHLTAVRVGTHEGFDRITFQFRAPPGSPGGEGVPRYLIRRVEPPLTRDPSDLPMSVDGDAFLQIVFLGASGVDLSGPTVVEVYRGPKELRPGFPVLLEAEEQGDFEATLAWILGLSGRACWHVTELAGPTRVAVDLLRP